METQFCQLTSCGFDIAYLYHLFLVLYDCQVDYVAVVVGHDCWPYWKPSFFIIKPLPSVFYYALETTD